MTRKINERTEAMKWSAILLSRWFVAPDEIACGKCNDIKVSEHLWELCNFNDKGNPANLLLLMDILLIKILSILQLIIQGKIVAKRGPGRRKTSWLKKTCDNGMIL